MTRAYNWMFTGHSPSLRDHNGSQPRHVRTKPGHRGNGSNGRRGAYNLWRRWKLLLVWNTPQPTADDAYYSDNLFFKYCVAYFVIENLILIMLLIILFLDDCGSSKVQTLLLL